MNSLNSLRRFLQDGRRLQGLVAAIVVACVTVVGTSAFAQESASESELEEKLESYWSVDRELSSVEDRLYTRDGRFAVGLYTGLLSSEPFFYYYPVGGRLSYFFSDHLGVEVEGSFMDSGLLTHNTELTNFFEADSGGFRSDLDTEDRFLWRAHAMVSWHPLYGKLAFLQRKLAHFDFNLSAGLGLVGVDRPNEFRTEMSQELAPEVVLGGGVQFFATSDIVVRLEGRVYGYQGATTPTNEDSFWDQVQVPTEFLLGASYMF